MTRCRHAVRIGPVCQRCATVQLDHDRWALDVRWVLLRDPDAAPLRHGEPVTVASARWQQVTEAWECEDCGETAPGRRREPPGDDVACGCTRRRAA